MNCGDGIGAAGRYNRQLFVRKKKAGYTRHGADRDAGELSGDVRHAGEGRSGAHRCGGKSVIDRTAARIAAGEGLEEKPLNAARPYAQRCGERCVLLVVRQGQGVYRRREMHRLRRMCEALSAEEHHVVGRKTALGGNCTAWPASATVLRRRLNTAKRARASPAITSEVNNQRTLQSTLERPLECKNQWRGTAP